ncbi:universal stress protein [Haloplanus aerogenes]|uniref:Nucleotide-binding universal stress UspA family protein n=1 Tax=Haloplanus aerogenes TaxID=660522 RepID=A0A3M0CX35_9EURY|nr:universal stress protein [Haloplanus aerogenes]AZH25030.1 universal stress protein [Haloplanus aerogenes]RMB13752.1 nucleotide-binding universal stress UspA family protein [Haloplanus aerogenes]
MYDRILVPTDGSDPASTATNHALTIAERFDATVHALYIVDVDGIAHEAPGLTLDTLRDTLRQEGKTATAAVAERGDDRGVDVTTAVVEGLAEDIIVDYADEEGIDLIVMGTHGRRGMDRYLVGSVTERVVRRTDVPTLVVRGEWD